MSDQKTFEISWATLWRAFFFVLLVMLMFFGRQILLGLFLAIVISSGLDTVVNFLEKNRLPRVLSVVLIFLLATFILIFVSYAILPRVISDFNSALLTLNESVRDFGFGPLFDPEVIRSINDLVASFSLALFSFSGASPLTAISQLLGGLGLAASVFVSAFYLSLSKDGVQRFIRAVFPAAAEETALRIYERSTRQMGLWFRTQIALSFIVGVLVWIALALLGVKQALLLALLAAMFEIVPYVGPILAGAAAVLTALSVSAPLALYTLIAFLAIQQLENHVLIPLLIRRSIGLHPVIVITALLIGFEVGGFLGLVIAVPAAAVFQEIIEEWSSKKRRGKDAQPESA